MRSLDLDSYLSFILAHQRIKVGADCRAAAAAGSIL